MAILPIHPGKILKEEMAEIGLSAAGLAKAIGVPANRISQILAGKRNVSADTALRLGKFLGTGPKLWLNLQSAYELDIAKLAHAPGLDDIVPITCEDSFPLAVAMA